MNQGAMMQQAMKGHQPAGNPNAIEPMTALPAGPAAIRVGVAELNNKTKSSISTGELRGRLVASLINAGCRGGPVECYLTK